jgi:hypothetical protein
MGDLGDAMCDVCMTTKTTVFFFFSPDHRKAIRKRRERERERERER